MRLPKRIAAVGTAGLIVGAFAGAPAAPAAQNYAPQCDATAKFTLQGLKVGYEITCTDFNDTTEVQTAGDSNQGAWTAKSYAEGDYVKYSNKWYRAALAATNADEPTKPRTVEGELITIWTEQSSDTAAAWSATSTSATTTAGSFPSGYVVSYKVTSTPNVSIVHYFKANAATVAADVPGVSAKWDDLGAYAATWSAKAYAKDDIVFKDAKFYKANAATVAGDIPGTAANWDDKGAQIASPTLPLPYTGPQVGGSKALTVKYPALVAGYSVLALNNEVDGFDTEPAILNAARTAPAPNQTQFCNGDHPGAGVSCSLQSAVKLYVKQSDSSYAELSATSMFLKNPATASAWADGSYAKDAIAKDSYGHIWKANAAVSAGDTPGTSSKWDDVTYLNPKATTFYGDNSLTGSPVKTSASTDFVDLGALGRPTNSGKMIMPATSGSHITGELEISNSPCAWGGSLKLVAITADTEGQMNTPISFEIPMSKYFRINKLKDGSRETQEIPAGCTFQYSSTSQLVYSYDKDFKVVPLTRPARGAATRVLAVK